MSGSRRTSMGGDLLNRSGEYKENIFAQFNAAIKADYALQKNNVAEQMNRSLKVTGLCMLLDV